MTQQTLLTGHAPLWGPVHWDGNFGGSQGTVTLDSSGDYVAVMFYCFDAATVDSVEFVITTITSSPAQGNVKITDVSSNAPGTTFNGGSVPSASFNTSSANSKVTVTGLAASLTAGSLYCLVIEWTSGNYLVSSRYGSSQACGLPYLLENTTSLTRVEPALFPFGMKTSGGEVIPIPGMLVGPVSSYSQASLNTGSNPDEVGISFQVSAPCTIAGAHVKIAGNSSSVTARMRLYSDPLGTPSTLLTATHAMSNYSDQSSTIKTMFFPFGSTQLLSVGTTYGITLRSTDTTSIQFGYIEYYNAADTVYLRQYSSSRAISRDGDTGAFSNSDATWGKRVPLITPMISKYGDDAGGGGSGIGAIVGGSLTR